MAVDRRWFRQFACPLEYGDPLVLDAVAVPHARAIAGRLAAGVRNVEGLTSFLAGWAAESDGTCGFDDVWDIAFGHAQSVLMSGRGDLVGAAVRVGVRLIEVGVLGAWRADVGVGSLRLGTLLLPEAEAVEASRDGNCAVVTLRLPGGGKVRVTQGEGGEWLAATVDALTSFDAGRPVRLLPRRAVPREVEGFDGVTSVETIDLATTEAFAAAGSVLATRAPDALAWVGRILRDVVVCVPEETFRAVSGSGEHAPGMIHVSHSLGRMDIAEILVHECAHQYFYLLERVGPLDDGSDRRLYWSPPIRRERPLSRVLMAYHALANVRLLYEAFRGAESEARLGDCAAYVGGNLPGLDAAVAELDVPLRGSPALTDLGRALYEPLAARIDGLR